MSTEYEELKLARQMRREMLRKLRINRHKKPWRETDMAVLLYGLHTEILELLQNPSWDEAADVANYAAMIADVAETRR